MAKIITKTAKQTFNLGRALAKKCHGGEIFGLIGDLGAGKTCLAQGLAAGFKIKGPVNSPTFVIMKIYKITGHKTLKQFCHIDAYRLENVRDLEAIGVSEYFKKAEAVVVVEWADQIKKILPPRTQFIELKHLKDNQREVKIK